MSVTAATAAWVVGAMSYRVHGSIRLALVVGGAMLTAIAAGLPMAQRRRANDARADALLAAETARIAMRVTLEDALDPLVHLVGRVATTEGAEKAQRRGEAIELALTAIAAVADADRIRVCFFQVLPGPPRMLGPEGFAGRAGAPSVVFTEGDPVGDAAFALMEANAWTFVADTEDEPPDCFWDVEPHYRTFLAGPVQWPTGEPIGLLTLDGEAPGDLAGIDLVLVRLIADLLADAVSG